MSIFTPQIRRRSDGVRGADRYDLSWCWSFRSGRVPLAEKSGLLRTCRLRRRGRALGSAEASPGEVMEQDRDHRRRRSADEQVPDSETGTVRWIASSTGRVDRAHAHVERSSRGPRSQPGRLRLLGGGRKPHQGHLSGTTPRTGRSYLKPADEYDADEGVEANARLTGMVLRRCCWSSCRRGVHHLLRIGKLLTLHVLIGMVVVPPVLLRSGSTTWRFARYYLGSPEIGRRALRLRSCGFWFVPGGADPRRLGQWDRPLARSPQRAGANCRRFTRRRSSFGSP